MQYENCDIIYGEGVTFCSNCGRKIPLSIKSQIRKMPMK